MDDAERTARMRRLALEVMNEPLRYEWLEHEDECRWMKGSECRCQFVMVFASATKVMEVGKDFSVCLWRRN